MYHGTSAALPTRVGRDSSRSQAARPHLNRKRTLNGRPLGRGTGPHRFRTRTRGGRRPIWTGPEPVACGPRLLGRTRRGVLSTCTAAVAADRIDFDKSNERIEAVTGARPCKGGLPRLWPLQPFPGGATRERRSAHFGAATDAPLLGTLWWPGVGAAMGLNRGLFLCVLGFFRLGAASIDRESLQKVRIPGPGQTPLYGAFVLALE